MIMFTGLLALEYHNLDMKSRKVCNKTRSPPASLLFKDQSTEHTTVKWPLHRIESSLIWYNTPLNYWKPYIHRTWICPNTKFFEPVDHVRGSTGGLKPKILRYSSNAEVIEDSWPVHVGDVDQYSRWCCCLGVLNRVIDTGGGSEAICCCNEPLRAFSQGFFFIHYRSTTTTRLLVTLVTTMRKPILVGLQRTWCSGFSANSTVCGSQRFVESYGLFSFNEFNCLTNSVFWWSKVSIDPTLVSMNSPVSNS